MSATTVDIGVDLGTSFTKAMALAADGRVLAIATERTRWERPHTAWAERSMETLLGVVDAVIAGCVERAVAENGEVEVRSIGFTSMAESGVLLDAEGRALAPSIAWFDPRGEDEISGLPPDFVEAFPRTCGLPVVPVASLFKLLWMRGQGVPLDGAQWLSLPELVCHHMGGARVSERSMLGRTGLLDIHSARPARASLELLGVGEDFVPPLVDAGVPVGRVRESYAVPAARGAVLTIAGHDHLVAAAASGAAGVGTVFDSMGTAEAFVAAAPAVPEPDVVAGMVEAGMTVYPHVIPGTTCVLAAGWSGLLLKRVLRLIDREESAARDALDAEAVASGLDPGEVEVGGCRMGEPEVRLTLRGDHPLPAQTWSAAVRASGRTAGELLDRMRGAGMTIDTLVLAGGWTHMRSVVGSREGLAPTVRRAELDQPGMLGAALFGRWAALHGEVGADPSGQAGPTAGWFALSE